MSEGYTVQSRVRRFSKSVAMMKKGNITVSFVEDERYIGAYEKLFSLIEKSGADKLTVSVAWANDNAISFLLRIGNRVVPLNYFVDSEFFESDRNLLKRSGFTHREIKKALQRAGERYKPDKVSLYLIPGGVGILAGEKTVKIRQG